MQRREEDLEEDFDGLNLRKTRGKFSSQRRRLSMKSSIDKSKKGDVSFKRNIGKVEISKFQPPLIDFIECNTILTKVMTLSLALNFKLFEVLEKSSKEISAEEIKNKLCPNTHTRHVMSILEKLHFHNYLDKVGEFPNYKYKNSKFTKKYFLLDSKESYATIYRNIDRYLKRFQQCDKKMHDGKFDNLVTELYQSTEESRNFVDYFLLVNQRNFDNLLEIFDFGRFEKILDSSGKNGALSSMIKSKYQKSQVTSFDHPILEDLAQDYLKSIKMSDDVKLIFGHIRDAEMPECDVIIAPHILQYFYEDDRQEILKKMFQSIRKDGYLIILENLMYEPKYESEIPAKKVSLLLTLEGYQGYNFSFEETKEILEDIGFRDVELVRKKGLSDLVFANKSLL